MRTIAKLAMLAAIFCATTVAADTPNPFDYRSVPKEEIRSPCAWPTP